MSHTRQGARDMRERLPKHLQSAVQHACLFGARLLRWVVVVVVPMCQVAPLFSPAELSTFTGQLLQQPASNSLSTYFGPGRDAP
jgi:hypothetical protein